MPVTCTNYKLKCGGCPLLNQPYPDQLKHKQQLEQRLLGRFAPVSPVLGQAEPWHYRNKAIATFATGPRGRLTCGIYAAGTHCNLVRRTEKGRLRRRGWGLRWEKAQKGGKGTNLRGFFED